MKFTKLTSAAFTAATVLSILAPVAVTHAATAENDPAGNNGTALPQTGKTEAGISFGDNGSTGNTGILRLQKVPATLDFGNHTKFDAQYGSFNAAGENVGLTSNDRFASYDNTASNKTSILNTSDTALKDVAGTAYVTVVDKQETRTASGKNTADNGDWQLSVKSDDALTGTNGKSLADAVLSFKGTKAAATADVYTLTGETEDQSYAPTAPSVAGTVASNLSFNLDGASEVKDFAVAATGEGQGANVFGWMPENITLTLPKTTSVENTVYKANLTWTLSTGI